jgi:hypothetical protein
MVPEVAFVNEALVATSVGKFAEPVTEMFVPEAFPNAR